MACATICSALGHAHNINVVERLTGEVVIDCAANCLQAYQQNDNFWDQGQLFYTPQMAWGMPPYYAQQMIARHYQPLGIRASVEGSPDLDISAVRSQDGKTLVVKAVNLGPDELAAQIEFGSDFPGGIFSVTCLAGDLDTRNTPEEPRKVVPQRQVLAWDGKALEHTFPAYSFTILEFKPQ